MRAGWIVGVDVGGTFTDAIAVNSDGRLRASKVASTPEDPSVALVEALDELAVDDLEPSDITLVFHGTTVATNALITGRTGRVVYRARESGWFYVEVKLTSPGAGPYELHLLRA